MRHCQFLPLLLLAAGCGRAPDTFTPPVQRRPVSGPEAHLGQFVAMNDATADSYILRDISKTTENQSWRWAYKHPAVRFYLSDTAGLKFVLDAGVPNITFRETGPMTVTILINDHELDRLRFDRPGIQHYEKAVPDNFLRGGTENMVRLEPDKQWISKEDGAALSFVMTGTGFVK